MLRDEPALTGMLELAMTCWRDLCGERHVGMALGPIPWRAIIAWADRYGVAEDEQLVELVQTIDTEWLRDARSRTTAAGHPQSAARPN
jgi:hypothetical protein